MRKISQREARALRQRVAELERQNERNSCAWARDYIGGVNIRTIPVNEVSFEVVRAARKLGNAIVALPDPNGKHELMIYAVKP